MNKHKASKMRESKADGANGKKTSLIKVGLWLGGFLLALFVAFTSLRSSGSIYSPPGTDSLDAAGKYIRRETKSTLSPELFVGKTAPAYRLAHEIPDALDHLYCYCHCDKSIGHITLLSCFTDTHATNCAVCQNEAIDAAAMLKKGSSLPQIRRQIDLKYGRI
jgi:Protein of unknown function with PCYCGC motif